jgi:hypothetical protein
VTSEPIYIIFATAGRVEIARDNEAAYFVLRGLTLTYLRNRTCLSAQSSRQQVATR